MLRLRREGVKCRRELFGPVTVSYILQNPIYYGNSVVNKHEYEGNRRTGKIKPESDHIGVEVSALISKIEWDKIQAKREFNKVKGKRISFAKDHFLRDSLVCAVCGGPVKPYTNGNTRKDGSVPRFYACLYHKITSKRLEVLGRRRCWLPTIKAEEIEDMVWSEIIQTLSVGGFGRLGEYRPSKIRGAYRCRKVR